MSDPEHHAEKEPQTDEEILAEAIKRFNKSPKKGIQYLVDRNKLEKTEANVVKFLTTNAKGLRKSAVGEYLGDGYAIEKIILIFFQRCLLCCCAGGVFGRLQL